VPNSVPFNASIADANSGTFLSALSNIDVRIGAGNAGAVGVRFHAAQHAFLSHMDFNIGSGLAGIYQVGNVGEDLRFFGGRYGILAEKTSPAWQFTLLDSTFTGQRDAAIREHEAGLTLVNTKFSNAPVAIEIDRGYGDWLWGRNVRFENISQAAVVISNEESAYTQVGFENATALNVPVFARFRDSGKTIPAQGAKYLVKSFSHGLLLPAVGQMGHFETRMDAIASVAKPQQARAIRPLPLVRDWVSVKTLGAKGDGTTDDTQALQQAIASHRVLYFPSGRYLVSDTLLLKRDSVLIGMHPNKTQIVLAEKLGLSAQSLFDVITGATGNCWSVHTNCPVPGPVPTSPANNDFKPGFATALMNKDLGLAMDAVSSTGSTAPLGSHAAEIYAKYAADHADKDFSAVIELLRGS